MKTFNFNRVKVILQQFMKIYILILIKKISKTCTKEVCPISGRKI